MQLQTVEYLLRFADGGQERYQVAYTASVEAEKSIQRWRYRGHASRQLSIYNRAGERFEKADVDRRVELLADAGQDVVADWHGSREYTFMHEPPLQADEFEAISARLVKSFAASVFVDKRRVENLFWRMYPGVEAVSEIP